MGAEGWMDRLAHRWAERAAYPGSAQRPPGPDATVEVSGEYVGEIALPPAQVWAALATPATHADVDGGFALPGPGPERWCLMTEVAGGLCGAVVEVVEREEGRRVVLRIQTPATTALRDWAVFDGGDPHGARSLVRLRSTARVRGAAAEAGERAMRTVAERFVTRLDHRLTGAPPPPPLRGGDGRHEHRSSSPLISRALDVQVVVPLPLEDVWAGVLDADAYHLDSPPGRFAAVVPGTPAGRMGEMRYEVCASEGREYVRFHEVVEVGPGHRLVLRHHSSSHPSDSVVTVSAHPDGSLVRVVREVVMHENETSTLDLVRGAHLGSLVALGEELLRRAAPGADEGDEPST